MTAERPMTKDLVEIVARYLCSLDVPAYRVETSWWLFAPAAVGALRAIEGAGMKVVGRDATEAMLCNGREALLPLVPRGKLTTDSPVQGLWLDMFNAAPTYGDDREG